MDICKAVAADLTKQLNLSSLSVAYVSVTAPDRFEAIKQHKADLLCEPTSDTLSRREVVDFSIATYVDGASLMIRPDGPRNLQELAGRKIGVLAGTTTEQELRNSLADAGLTAEVIPAKTHMRKGWRCSTTPEYRPISLTGPFLVSSLDQEQQRLGEADAGRCISHH